MFSVKNNSTEYKIKINYCDTNINISKNNKKNCVCMRPHDRSENFNKAKLII